MLTSTLILKVYEILPTGAKKFLVKSAVLRKLRNLALRNRGIPREVTVDVRWANAQFLFHAPIKVAEKAKNRGIENTLLRHTISLLANRPNAVIFDVGSNYGFLSIVWARCVASLGKVYSFEPHPRICSALSKSIELNDLQDRITLTSAAVGETNEPIKLFLYGTTSNKTSRPIDTQSVAEVKQITLDDFAEHQGISRCDLIKIDTDGSEYQVLCGAQKLIAQHKPIIVVETNGKQNVLTLLQEMEYTLLDMKLEKIKSQSLLTIPPNVFAIPFDQTPTNH